MKQVFLSGKGQVRVFDTPIPARLKDGMLVRTAFSVISAGTEGAAVTQKDGLPGVIEKLNNSRDRLDQVWGMVKSQGLNSTLSLIENKLNDHTAIGYSLAGVVVETDNDDIGFAAGDRVVCMGAGIANHAEYTSVPKNLAVQIPEGVRFEEATFGAIACIAMQGLRRLELEPGEKVAVVGLGLIGQIAFRLAASMGLRPYGFDIDEARVDKAARHAPPGAVFNSDVSSPIAAARAATGGHGFDGVVVCASAKADSLINQVFDMCRKRGRVSIVGDIGLGLERAKMYAKELELRLSCSYGVGRYDPEYELGGRDYPLPYVRWTERRNLEYFLDLLATGRLDISDLVSDRFPIEEAGKAYAAIKSEKADIFGVLLDYHLPDVPERPAGGTMVRYHETAAQARTLAIGMIGVGAYAKNIHVPNLCKLDTVKINGIASRTGGTAAVVAKKTQAGFATSDTSELLRQQDIDAVVISTRHATHAALVIEALQAGKHVFVEKPMATTVADCLSILNAQATSGRVVRVGYNRRFSPMLQAMKGFVGSDQKVFTQRVSTGDIGQHWSNTAEEGGRLLGEGVHFFDLSNWMMDAFPTTVAAQFVGKADPLNPNVSISLGYPDGSVSTLVYTSLGSPSGGKEYFELFGNGRSATIDDYKLIQTYGGGRSIGRPRKGEKGQAAAMNEFVNACLSGEDGGGANVVAGLWATAIYEAALESGKIGRKIDLNAYLEAVRNGA